MIRFRRWLCRKFNLVGAETTIKVAFEGSTLLRCDLETLRCLDEISPRGGKPPRFGLDVIFDWKP